jgi:hypothetical protein
MITVIKVGNVWSWLVARIRGSGSSPKSGHPVKGLPPIPSPRAHKKSRYSIVIISESGTSRQIELTPIRLRIAAAVLVVLGVVIAAGLVGLTGTSVDVSGIRAERDLLAEKVRSLEETLKRKELAVAAMESGAAPSESASSGEQTYSASSSGPGAGESAARGQAAEDQASVPVREVGAAPPGIGSEPVPVAEADPSPFDKGTRSAGPESPRTGQSVEDQLVDASRPEALVSFDAEGVTAFSERGNRGVLRFRLVKNQPKIRFSGYLFVFVQMVDKRGEDKIYAYPKRTRLGEEDLPTDYRKGESVSFKFNSSVELPFEDIRPGARLAGVTILLYGEDGSIVYQRGFARSELKRVSGKATRVNGVPAKGKRNRRAL